MKFGPVPLEQAEGKVLAHHIAGPNGGHAFRKGKPLGPADIAALRELGRRVVYVAELEPGDLDENEAASRVAQAVCGSNLSVTKPHVGRVNLQAEGQGVVQVDVERLARLNEIEGITLATLPSHTAVRQRQTVATVKVIPFAIPENSVRSAEAIGAGSGGAGHGEILGLQPLLPRDVYLILSGSKSACQRVWDTFEAPLRTRIEALGSRMDSVVFVPAEEDDLGEEALAQALEQALSSKVYLVVLAGETAVMDRYDRVPRAIESLGGEVIGYGAPVDPGNLLLLASLGETLVLGVPGCARSLKPNVIDWVLPRLLAGERLTRADIVAMGHGGLLESQPELPYSASAMPVSARKPGDRAE